MRQRFSWAVLLCLCLVPSSQAADLVRPQEKTAVADSGSSQSKPAPADGAVESKNSPEVYSTKFVLKDQHDLPMAHFPYKITVEDGSVYYGRTNERGESERVYTGNSSKKVSIDFDDRILQKQQEESDRLEAQQKPLWKRWLEWLSNVFD